MTRSADPIAPASVGRRCDPAALLTAATAAGRAAGVTRLADVTGLDRIGLPVWQAIRPLGRALSVHQGKGASVAAAQLGALLEAVESDCAERYEADGPVCRRAALPRRQRSSAGDFVLPGHRAPDQPIRWACADELVGGGALYVPEDVVSLDLTRDTEGPFERSSSGVAAGSDAEDATFAALCELIERDAMGTWRRAGPLAAMAAAVDLDTVPFAWWAHWRGRLDAAGVVPSLYRVPALGELPVFAVALRDRSRGAIAYRATHGGGCHPDAELALFRALAEAVQARATYVSGARDDLGDGDYAVAGPNEIVVAFALPPPSGGRCWEAAACPPRLNAAGIITLLAAAGFGQVGRIELGRPAGLSVVRVVVPGLASLERPRRRRER